MVHKEGQRTFEADPQNIGLDPQGKGRTSESGPREEDRTLNWSTRKNNTFGIGQ